MKYSILGFNQAKLLETDLDLTDITILNYIINAIGTPNMYYKLDEDDKPLVWIYHAKLLDDLPILRMSEGTLRNRLNRLKQQGYIKSESFSNNSGRGSRTYYGITEMTVSLIYDTETMTVSRKNDTISRPCHEKMTPNNILKNNDNKLNNTISKDIVTVAEDKPKKLNLYDKCVNLINNYTSDEKLRHLLLDYLKMRLAMKDKPLYGEGQFRGILNKLNTLGGDPFEIVNYCIERGYASFYPPTNYKVKSNKSNKFGETDNMSSKKVTQEEIDNGYFTNETY